MLVKEYINMNITVYPTPLYGIITAPSSKSLTHRALICAALAKGTSEIIEPLVSGDTTYTYKTLEKLGVKFIKQPHKLIVNHPKRFLKISTMIDCGESGSTIRFLIPLLAVLQNGGTFKGSKRLIERIDDNDLKALGLNFIKTPNTINILTSQIKNNLTLEVKNTTQLVSGILMASPLVNEQINILINEHTLDPYIVMTTKVLETFGINIEVKKINDQIALIIPSNQKYRPTSIIIEGDYSAASNLLVMGMLGKGVSIKGLSTNSYQGDKSIIDILRKMNAKIDILDEIVTINYGNPEAISIDLSINPDLAPLLMGLASISNGTSYFTGLNRLYHKESNRVDDTIQVLTKLGARIYKVNETIIINGQELLAGGVTIDSYNDHRLVMMVCAISSKLIAPVKIKNAHVVEKSYPNFWQDFYTLGAKFTKEA